MKPQVSSLKIILREREINMMKKSLQKFAFQGVERYGIILLRTCDLPEKGVHYE